MPEGLDSDFMKSSCPAGSRADERVRADTTVVGMLGEYAAPFWMTEARRGTGNPGFWLWWLLIIYTKEEGTYAAGSGNNLVGKSKDTCHKLLPK